MKKDSPYFSHDYNASNDPKILFMRQQLGMEGYGIYWFIVEQLAQAGGTLPLKIAPILAMQTHATEAKVNSVIQGYELFVITEEEFFSVRLCKHLEVRKVLSESGKKGAKTKWELAQNNSHPNSHPNSPAYGNKRKEKEIKEKKVNKNIFIIPSIQEVYDYAQQIDLNYIECDKFFDYYNSKGWMVGKSKMKDWQSALRNWQRNNFNKQGQNNGTATSTYEKYNVRDKAIGLAKSLGIELE